MTKTISANNLADLNSKKRVVLLDVRTPIEFREMHAEFAKNVPLNDLDPASIMSARNGSASEPLYVICQKGGRGAKACETFEAAGYDHVVNVEGGTEAWIANGLPVVRGKKAISLERQVRIVAGSIILLCGVLAIIVHPYFAGIAAFMGAGLAFAGITDTCGMGLMMAKMPWNQISCNTHCETN